MTTSLEKASRTRAFVRLERAGRRLDVRLADHGVRPRGPCRERVRHDTDRKRARDCPSRPEHDPLPGVGGDGPRHTRPAHVTELALEGRDAERRQVALLSAAWATLALAVIAVVVFAPRWRHGRPDLTRSRRRQRETTTTLLQLLVPVIVFNGLLGAASASLVSERRFGIVGAGAVVSNVPVLIGLAANPGASVELVAVLLMAGYGVQAAYLGLFAFAARRSRPRVPLTPEQKARVRKELKKVGLLAPPIMLAIGMANLSGIIDLAFSSLVSTGAPAAFDKAFRLVALPYGVFAVAIGIVALPALVTREARVRRRPGADAALRRDHPLPDRRRGGFLADELSASHTSAGSSTRRAANLTADALVGLSFALPALGFSLVGTRAWIGRQRPWTPATLAVVGVVVNGALNAVLIGPLGSRRHRRVNRHRPRPRSVRR